MDLWLNGLPRSFRNDSGLQPRRDAGRADVGVRLHRMIKIAITEAAFKAITATLPLGSVAVIVRGSDCRAPGIKNKSRSVTALSVSASVRAGARSRDRESSVSGISLSRAKGQLGVTRD
jgi:hypothetical protein